MQTCWMRTIGPSFTRHQEPRPRTHTAACSQYVCRAGWHKRAPERRVLHHEEPPRAVPTRGGEGEGKKCLTRRGAKLFIAKRKGNIHVDVRARGRAKRSAPRKAAGYTRVAPKSTKLLRHPNRQWHADTRAHRHSGTQTLAHDGTHGTVARRHSHTTAPTAQWHVDTRTQRHLRHSGT